MTRVGRMTFTDRAACLDLLGAFKVVENNF